MWGNNEMVTAKTDTILSDYSLLEREVPNGNADVDSSVVRLSLKIIFNGLKERTLPTIFFSSSCVFT